MRYSIEPKDRIFLKGYEFLSFTKSMGKNLSNKYSQNFLDRAKNFTKDAIKTSSKRAIQKTTEATGDFIDNKIADEITNVSKELHSKMSSATLRSKNDDANSEIEVAEKDTYPQKKEKKLLMN